MKFRRSWGSRLFPKFARDLSYCAWPHSCTSGTACRHGPENTKTVPESKDPTLPTLRRSWPLAGFLCALTVSLTLSASWAKTQTPVAEPGSDGAAEVQRAAPESPSGMAPTNRAPVIEGDKTRIYVIDENHSGGTLSPTDQLVATDPDGDPIEWGLEGISSQETEAINAAFSIFEGWILVNGDMMDFETRSLWTLIVTASDGQGGKGMATVAVFIDDLAEPPSAPAMPSLEEAGATRLAVNWTTPDNTGPAITDYDLRYCPAVDAGDCDMEADWTDAGYDGVPETGSTTAGITITDLEPSTTYEVQVRATNDEGTGDWSPSLTARTTGHTVPEAPMNLVLSSSDSTIAAIWDEPASDGGYGILGYTLHWRQVGAGWPPPNTPNMPGVFGEERAASTAHIIGELANDTDYEVRVRAVNLSGHGPWSNIAPVRTNQDPPSFGAQTVDDQKFTVGAEASLVMPQATGGKEPLS